MTAPARKKVLLVGWDGADWEHINPLLEAGLLPNLDALINRGVIGNLATLQPVLSPMLWNSVATGKFADKHGIHGFIEPDPVNGGARPYTSTARKTKALWNILTQSRLKSNIVGWWASHPAEPIDGVIVTNAFGGTKLDPEKGWIVPGGAVHPPELGRDLARFRVFPTELTEAHILPFIPNAAKIDQKTKPELSSFAKILGDNATVHAVATAIMEHEPWDFMAVYYDGIDHFAHAFMPYHPPRLPWIKEEDFEMYKDVIKGAYRFHDMMLARLLQLAGPETTVILCSDHGFESGAQRPHGIPREPAGPAVWHRQYGIFVMAGEGIRKDERIYGASLIDLTPTILTLFGLPVGQDMDGRPLLEAFETPPPLKTIPSWDDVPGESGMHQTGQGIDRDQAQELMQQFAALGYIEDPTADKEKQAQSAEIEAKYNVARTLIWKNAPQQAIPLLEDIARRRPWEERFLIQLAAAYFHAGYLRQAERLLEATYDFAEVKNANLLVQWARVKLALLDFETGLRALQTAAELNPRNPNVYTQLGGLYLQLLRWEDARAAFEQAVALDDDDARAHEGLAILHRRAGDNQATVDEAMRAVSLLHRLPRAHFSLGVALARSEQFTQACVAFETALRFQPDMINAHRYLAMIYRATGNPDQASHHRAEARRLARRGRPTFDGSPEIDKRRETLFDLPDIPSPEERYATLLRERPTPEEKKTASGKEFVLVSGLPRSGTSLMMQMLAAGGLPPKTDGERAADVDNPEGYLEWEAIKRVGREPHLLDEPGLEGHAIKVVSALLQALPRAHRYKVIFMQRPVEEIVRSQAKMIARLGTSGADQTSDKLAHALQTHRESVLATMRKENNVFEVLEVDYLALVADPAPWVTRVVEFVGTDHLPHPERMAGSVRADLHRNRK